MVRFGRVVGTHGLKGALKIRPDNPDRTSRLDLTRLFVGAADDAIEKRVLKTMRAGSALAVLLEGIDTIEAAQAFKGREAFVAAGDLPQLGKKEFYYFEMVGYAVRLTDGRELGVIEEIFSNGAHDIWVVRKNGSEFLIPVIEDVVRSIDNPSRVAIIEPIPGLLD